MQTVYYTTSNFIRHQGNVVDLAEYRRKLALAQEGSLAPQPRMDWEEAEDLWEGTEEQSLPRVEKPRRRSRLHRQAMVLDICASLGVVIMTLSFALQVLGT